jgi:hypothetical protein
LRLRESAIIFVLSVSLFAQTDTPPIEPIEPAQTEYGGPAILSRGGTSSLLAPSRNIRFRPFLSLTAAYDTGLTPVVLGRSGQVPNDASIGGEAEVGLLGFHKGKTVKVGIDYRGSYHHYSKNTYYNGTEQLLSLAFTKQATRRTSFTLRESAGIATRNTFGFIGGQIIDPNFSNVPNNELFDGRTLYLNTMGDMTYQKSARLSLNAGADGFLIRRRSSALYGVTGYRIRGDAAYRTSRSATSGVAYDFTHFEFTKGFGASDIHTVQLVQSYRIGRYWELAMKAGGSRVETLGLTRVNIDPVIAAIIGRTTAIEVAYRINWVPSVSVNLTRSFRHAWLSFTYDRGVTPGNGVFLTSRQETANAGYSYTGIRRLNLGIQGGYTYTGSLTQTIGAYTGFNGGGGLTYNLTKALHFVTRYDYRHYEIGQSSFLRDSYRASMGFSFSPGDVPLALW